VFRGDGETGSTEEGCVGYMVEGLLLVVVMELLTGCAAEGGIAGGVNAGGIGTCATIERIEGIHVGREEEFDSACNCSKLGYGKVDSSN
jgi:hypothetical protein